MWQGLRGKSSLGQISFQCSSSLLSGFISSPWCIPFMDHHRECTCSLLGASLYIPALKWVIILISIKELHCSGSTYPFPSLCHCFNEFSGLYPGLICKAGCSFHCLSPRIVVSPQVGTSSIWVAFLLEQGISTQLHHFWGQTLQLHLSVLLSDDTDKLHSSLRAAITTSLI